MTRRIIIVAIAFAMFLSPCWADTQDCSNNLFLNGGCGFKSQELTILWQLDLLSNVLYTPVSMSVDKLVCTTDKSVAMVNPLTGQLKWEWKMPVGCRWSAASLGSNSVAAFGVNELVCLGSSSGNKKWSKTTASPITAQPVSDEIKIYAPTGKSLQCFDCTTGNQLWAKDLTGYVSTTPCVFDGKIYLATIDGSQIALNSTDGSVFWECKTGENPTDVLVASSKHIYLTSEKSLYAIDRISGKPIWKFISKSDAFSPSVSDKYLFYPSIDGTLYCLDAMTLGKGCCMATAKQLWSLNTNSKYSGRAIAASDHLYMTSTDGWIFKVQNDTGDIAARYSTGFDLSKAVFLREQVVIPYGRKLISISDTPENIKLFIDKPILARGSFSISTDAGAKVINGKSMIPARTVLEPFGGTTSWNESEKTVTCRFEGKKLEIKVGQSTAILNNKIFQIDTDKKVTAMIINGKVMVPARFMTQEYMGMDLLWYGTEKSFVIKRRK
jgi:outer membrane protein assembly factor BamB